MKKLILISVILLIVVYFSVTLLIFPQQYLSNEQFVPIAFVDVKLSESEIILGDSFRLNITSGNQGEYGDIHILSTAFPNLQTTENTIEIVTYDFTHSPKFIMPGDEIGAKYSGGVTTTRAQYPSIEAMNRPVLSGSEYHMDLVVTPKETGSFLIYVKSINIPHTSDKSHFPISGFLDHQDEHVLVYSIDVTS